MKWLLLMLFSSVPVAATLEGQDFTNFDFESAKVTFIPNTFVVATSNALPGWSAFLGTNELSAVQYNSTFLPNTMGLVGTNPWVLSGHFSASLVGDESISQTGLVPSDTESLLFAANSHFFLVSLGGQNLSCMAISNALNSYGTSYTIYAANVSAFAGQTETLTFSAPLYTYGILDDIRFSPEAVPELSSISLLGLGGGILFYVRKRRRFRLSTEL